MNASSSLIILFVLSISCSSPVAGFTTTSTFTRRRYNDHATHNGENRNHHRHQHTAAAAVADYALTPPPQNASFNDRMRRLWNAGEEDNQNQKRRNRSGSSSQQRRVKIVPSNVQEVTDIQSYKEIVCDESDKIVVVRFYAPWCAMCRAVKPYFYKLANSLPEVKFVEVPCTEKNAALHQALGVPSLPYGHIYYPQGLLVEEASLNKKRFSTFARKVQAYADGQCDLKSVGDTSDPYYHGSSEAK